MILFVLMPGRAFLRWSPPDRERARESRTKEGGRQRRTLDPEMRRHVAEDARERADSEARVIGDGDVMRAALLCREAHVTARLARHGVAVATEDAREIAA